MFLLLLCILAVLAILFFFEGLKRGRLPPGPMGLPIFGYYFFFGKNPLMKLHKLSKKYGSIFSLRIGPQHVVFFDDWESTKDALSRNSTMDKLESLFDHIPYEFGIEGVNGAVWVQQRHLAERAIKAVSMSKGRWEDALQEDVLDFVNRTSMKQGRPVEVCMTFAQILVNAIAFAVFGERLHSNKTLSMELVKAVMAVMELTPALGMKNFSRKLDYLLKAMCIEKKDMLDKHVLALANYVSDTVDSKLQNSLNEIERNSYLGIFLEEFENHKTKKISYTTVHSMKGDSMGILTATGEGLSGLIVWALIAMADHPDEQEKVHQELDSVIGKNGVIKWSEKSKVPYTYASLLESMRWKTLIPFIIRKASEGMVIQGYHIPKGTPLLFNTWSVHNDDRYWETPELFMPERFLLDDGQKVNSSPESYNPFSLGKRSCAGKYLVLKTAFMVFTILMQKFKVMPKSGEKVEYDTVMGLSYRAKNVELRFIPR